MMEISQENTTLTYLWLTVNLNREDAITASGNGDSEVEKQTAKFGVWNLFGYNPILMETLWILHIAILVVIEMFYEFYINIYFWRYRPALPARDIYMTVSAGRYYFKYKHPSQNADNTSLLDV